MLCDLIRIITDKGLDIEWPPKGMCFSYVDSQTVGGFIATNVHNSYTPTAYDWIESIDVATYCDGSAQITNVSRTQNKDLFDSLFGGVSVTGIIVSATLRLRKAKTYTVMHDSGDIKCFKTCLGKIIEIYGSHYMLSPHRKKFHAIIRIDEPIPKPRIIYDGHIWTTHKLKPGIRGKVGGRSVIDPRWLKRLHKMAQIGFTKASVLFALHIYDFWLHMLPPAGQGLHFLEANIYDMAIPKPGGGYDPASIVGARRSLRLSKAHVTASQGGFMDISMTVRSSQYTLFSSILSEHFEHKSLGWAINIRHIPKCGGGIVACNALEDVICLEFNGVESQGNIRWLRTFLDACLTKGVTLQPSLAKYPFPHAVLRESLTFSQRMKFSNLMKMYDPDGLLNTGKVKFQELLSLQSVSDSAQEAIPGVKVLDA